MNPLAWLFVALGVFTGGLAGGVYVTRDHYKGVLAKEHLAQSNALLAWEKKAADSVAANETLKSTLEVQHAQANEALNVLLSHPADRVRLPASPCRAVLPQVVSPAGSAVPVTPTERTSDPAQAAFDDAQAGMESDAIEWRNAIEACRPVMEWSKAQGK